MSADFHAFSLSLREFKQSTERQAKLLQAKVTLQLLRGFILGNPVDTGRMRAGWVVGVGDSPSYEPPEGLKDESRGMGAAGVAHVREASEGMQRLSELPLGTPTYVVNNVKYSAHVNALHPNKARFVEAVIEEIIKPVLPKEWLKDTRYLINPTGRFVVGGPQGDCGLTGRKIIVDTYGGACPHGGGAFSGKDPSKVDRSAAYAARYVAKNIVAAGLATQCQVQVAYAIGVARPMNITVNTAGTGVISDDKLSALVAEHFDLRPKGIIQMLDLLRPIYTKTAAYGHFGREEPEFTWERTDKAAALKAAAGVK